MQRQTLYAITTEAAEAPGLCAPRNVPVGSKVCRVSGLLSGAPTRTSLQIGASLHIDSGTAEWRFIEHSCAPNLEMDFTDWSFWARRDIAAHERLTFNYLTTEARMAAPFTCRCGCSECFDTIAGFSTLAPSLKRRLSDHVAPHLRDAEIHRPGGCIFGVAARA
ncbi:SET domain-containing protein-lysine N-methyltransferase [Sphingomonas sp. BIUV-7]|uniref:SET domain-containing protein-lysine N-methyltransferase n=1 Tax=Sphingomonas natans TaxID=3063330 RepID=A0ABT8YCY1_9SPHN|nr:SET domain-containing protein-lysine N-methyltransferase [Sphingomonas sp. BIUV-7]MDO6416197.1 SET domain-containing protein-lysine N-methyltransferase [Sphingomonas sp. BIUV-7]